MKLPNIIFILADDLGYGDVSCFNPRSRIATPNIDRIAAGGMRFTDAHAVSAICSPSRYGVLTGRYCWRTMQKGIVGVYGDTILPPSRMTIANLLKQKNYSTGCFGKWHLGMGWNKTAAGPGGLPEVDFTKPVTAGPTTNGFDVYFGVDVPNWPPYCFIDGTDTVGVPSGIAPFGLSNEEISVKGPYVQGWRLEDILPTITERACAFIEDRANDDDPFFLYFPLTSPHTPLAVNEPWRGKSGLNLYADFVMETDAMVGRVLETLDKMGIAQNTVVAFASDNGCAYGIGVPHLESKGHFPSYIYRGYKSDIWDGGHRIPFVIRWPDVIGPGSVFPHPASLADFFATAAQIAGCEIPDSAGEDSISFLPVLQGGADPIRDVIVSHSMYGKFTIRKGPWKLILCAGSGGFRIDCPNHPSDAEARDMGLPPYQLYNLDDDINEAYNRFGDKPEVVGELLGILRDYVSRGRSTPGTNQKNDIEIILDPEEDSAVLLDDL